MKKLITITATLIVLVSCRSDFEKAYFEGQKDALNGDVRIMKDKDGCWKWKTSCWDEGVEPDYVPNVCN